MKANLILAVILPLVATQLVFSQEAGDGLKGEVKVKLLDRKSPEFVFIETFWKRVIIKRDLPFAMAYFCHPHEYKKLKEVEGVPESFREINYMNLKSHYLEDCSELIDMLPRVNVDHIHLRRIDVLPMQNPLVPPGGKIYKGVFSYADGPEKFEVVFPTVVKVGDKLKFSTRFWVPLKFGL